MKIIHVHNSISKVTQPDHTYINIRLDL